MAENLEEKTQRVIIGSSPKKLHKKLEQEAYTGSILYDENNRGLNWKDYKGYNESEWPRYDFYFSHPELEGELTLSPIAFDFLVSAQLEGKEGIGFSDLIEDPDSYDKDSMGHLWHYAIINELIPYELVRERKKHPHHYYISKLARKGKGTFSAKLIEANSTPKENLLDEIQDGEGSEEDQYAPLPINEEELISPSRLYELTRDKVTSSP